VADAGLRGREDLRDVGHAAQHTPAGNESRPETGYPHVTPVTGAYERTASRARPPRRAGGPRRASRSVRTGGRSRPAPTTGRPRTCSWSTCAAEGPCRRALRAGS
jgi:hypothetical protein